MKILDKVKAALSLENDVFEERFFNIRAQEKSVSKNVNKLNVISWNFSYGYGVGSAGLNYYQKPKGHFVQALNQSSQLLKQKNCDIIFLQEVDFFCKKTHFMDQLEFLGAKLDMNYAYCTSWKSPYIPFPYLSFEDHFGKTISGGGILTKHEIIKNQIFLLPKTEENPAIYNLFYPRRYLQIVWLKINDKIVKVGNIHLEAFKDKTRKKQSRLVASLVKKFEVDIFAGDLNTVPLAATKRDNFPYYEDDSYVGDRTIENFYNLESHQDFVSEEEYAEDEVSYFTFPSNKPQRKLDYIFYSKRFEQIKKEVIKSDISDHLPVFVKLKI